MNSPFNIVLVEHPEFRHAAVFHDLAKLLKVSLNSLGYSVTVQRNGTTRGAVNIILGYQFVAPPDDVYWIPYQLEQLSDANERMGPRWLEVLAAAPQIWDYDPANIAFLEAHGVRTTSYVPIGFHPAMREILDREPDIDVLHYGSLSQRRRKIIDSLAPHCRVHAVFGLYDAKRDEAIARSKIILNIHLHEASIYEQARVSYLLSNGRCVVSEDSPFNPYAGMVADAPYDRLVERCLALLADDSERKRLAAQGAARFEAMPMTEILSAAIERISATTPRE